MNRIAGVIAIMILLPLSAPCENRREPDTNQESAKKIELIPRQTHNVLPPGRICSNAQDKYKYTVWEVVIYSPDPSETATVYENESEEQELRANVTLHKINVPLNQLRNGDIFGVRWKRNNGFYNIRGFLNSAPGIYDIEGEIAFRFILNSESYGSDVHNHKITTKMCDTLSESGNAIVKWGEGNNLHMKVYPSTYPLNMYERVVEVSRLNTHFRTNSFVSSIHRSNILNDYVEMITIQIPLDKSVKLNIRIPPSEEGANSGGGTRMSVSYTPTDGDLEPQCSEELQYEIVKYPHNKLDATTDVRLACHINSIKRNFNMANKDTIKIVGARAMIVGAAGGGNLCLATCSLFNSSLEYTDKNVMYSIKETEK